MSTNKPELITNRPQPKPLDIEVSRADRGTARAIARRIVRAHTPSQSLTHYLSTASDFGLTNLCAKTSTELAAIKIYLDPEDIRAILLMEGAHP